jgi:hypothetical protein
MDTPVDKNRKSIFEITALIQFFSAFYIAATVVMFFPSMATWIGAIVLTFVLPATTWGIPFDFGVDFSEGGAVVGEWAFRPLLGVALFLSLAVFWSAKEMRRFGKKGLYMYTGIVGLLTVGVIIDAFRETLTLNLIGNILHGHWVNSLIPLILWILFMGSVLMLWYRFKKLEEQGS